MGKSWMLMSGESEEFNDGLEAFLDLAFETGDVIDGTIICPCKSCRNGERVTKKVAGDHVKSNGFAEEHTNPNGDTKKLAGEGSSSGELSNAGEKELPDKPADKIHTFSADLLQIKREHNMSDYNLFELLGDAFPPGDRQRVPKSYEEMLKVLGEEDDSKTLPMKQKRKAAAAASASSSSNQIGSSSAEEN